MRDILWLFIAIFLPALLGYAWLHLLWRDGHQAARIGYGYLIGLFLSTLVLYGWGVFGFSLDFLTVTFVLLLLLLTPIFLKRLSPREAKSLFYPDFNTSWHHWVWWLLSVLLAIRFGGLLLEEVLRPLYPWDAWVNWAPKAKVWFELKELMPFVHYSQWPMESLEEGAYALGNPNASIYPPLVPLVQLWAALGLGEWRDNWINLSWILCAVAFFLAFYGQLRMLRIDPLWSMIAAYLLFSMPYLNTHVALAGYAELWLAAFYCAAVMALINWSVTGSRIQLVLVLLMGIACIFTKKPGLVWALTLVPGILLVLFPVWLRYLSLLMVLAGGVSLFISGGISINFTGNQELIISSSLIQIPRLGQFPLEYHSIGKYFVNNELFLGNWHMLGWILLLLVPLSLLRALADGRLLPGLAVVVTGIIFIFVVFFFTDHYQAALNSTTINRATFHLLPSLFYFVLFVLWIDKASFQPDTGAALKYFSSF